MSDTEGEKAINVGGVLVTDIPDWVIDYLKSFDDAVSAKILLSALQFNSNAKENDAKIFRSIDRGLEFCFIVDRKPGITIHYLSPIGEYTSRTY